MRTIFEKYTYFFLNGEIVVKIKENTFINFGTSGEINCVEVLDVKVLFTFIHTFATCESVRSYSGLLTSQYQSTLFNGSTSDLLFDAFIG